jgi:uncharacterized protein
VEAFLRHAAEWAGSRGDLAAVALVGSWARNEPREDSDVDLVLLTDDPTPYTRHDDWILEVAPGATLVRTGLWGVIAERRLRLPSGLEIEIGLGLPSWAATDPIDDGTRRVVQKGFRSLYDPRGLLRNLDVAALDQERGRD